MKKILFTCAVALAAIAISTNNFAGRAHTHGQQFNAYAANDTIPRRKDTTKKDTNTFAFNVADTIPKRDTIKRDTTAFAFAAFDTIPKKDTIKRDTTGYALYAKN